MANKKITDVDVVSTASDADYLFVNQGSSLKQIKKSDVIKDVNIAVDTTLSVAGQAADAKATGDAISSLSEEIENLDVRSIADISKTASELLVDTYTITYTDGTSSTFQVTNGSSDEAYIASVIRSWLDEHPEATTTVQPGAVTMDHLADDVVKMIKQSGGNGYKYEYIGCPFPALDAYQAWPIAGVQYDRKRNKVMCLVTDSDKHVDATNFRLNLYSLDPVTSEVELIQTLKDNTTDPVVDVHQAFASQRGFLIDNDTGIYYKFHFGDDKTPYACKSINGGVTWTDITISETNSSSILHGGGNGNIIKTSSGRIICGLFYNGFAYTDDYFQTLTYVTSGKVISNGSACCHEYELIEYDVGKIIAIMRYTWSSTNNGEWNGTKVIEPAYISFSENNGETWTVPVASTSITNMSATNCVSFMNGNLLELYVGCRYPIFADKNGAIFRYTAELSDIINDKFEFKETMFYFNSENNSSYDDTGNLAGCVDSVGNFHLFYNDGKASGTSRWHYIKVCKATDNNSGIQEKPKNKYIQTYNAISIDTLLNIVYKHVEDVKNDLLLKIGELPESGDIDNPTYWITDGLLAIFKFTEDYFDTATSAFRPMYGGGSYNDAPIYTKSADGIFSTMELVSSKSITTDNLAELIQNALLDSTNGYTIEIDITTDPSDNYASNPTYILYGNMLIYERSIQIMQFSTTSAKTYDTLGKYPFTSGNKGIFESSRIANTFTWTFDRTNQRACAYLNGTLVLDSNDFSVSDGYSLDIAEWYGVTNRSNWKQYSWTAFLQMATGAKSGLRFYNRSLSADEVKANAIYSNA